MQKELDANLLSNWEGGNGKEGRNGSKLAEAEVGYFGVEKFPSVSTFPGRDTRTPGDIPSILVVPKSL